jgi:phage repressor protein C with HTH and peptisase S24 domain
MPISRSFISAGPAAEICDDYSMLDINYLITNGREGFLAFEVTGDSMVDHIHPGNLVFVDTHAQPLNGSVVAASVNGLTCVKIFQRQPGGLYLISANKTYKPREVTSSDSFHVLGVVRGHLAVYR